jgi:hypothetical protein
MAPYQRVTELSPSTKYALIHLPSQMDPNSQFQFSISVGTHPVLPADRVSTADLGEVVQTVPEFELH